MLIFKAESDLLEWSLVDGLPPESPASQALPNLNNKDMTMRNDNLPTEQQPENPKPTIRELQGKMYDYSLMIDEVRTFTHLVKEHFESDFNISNEESLHCFSMLHRNVKELVARHNDISEFIEDLRHLEVA